MMIPRETETRRTGPAVNGGILANRAARRAARADADAGAPMQVDRVGDGQAERAHVGWAPAAAPGYLDDNILLDGLRNGSPGAVEALFERFHAKIFGLAMSILKNESDAEEATQDVFMTVFRKAFTFKGDSALYSWIYRICVNACLMRLRGKKRTDTVSIEEFLPVFTADGGHVSRVGDWGKEVERKLLDKELGDVIRKFTGKLPEKYRVVFILSDVEGLSNEETAQILSLSVPAVKSRLHRARLYLRERIGRYLRHGRVY